MSLAAGHLLGPYQILAPLGAGGMGEVYRARDTKLNRDVAIKVLPAALSNDADYLARFQREAQVLASLNHPNIAAIYGLEGNAIVMELVEGETLTTPLELDVALHTARQIAEALEAAHERGVIHRDLKPGNIKVTPDGTVKVLDFGLAKAIEQTSSVSTANSPTLTVRATQAGIILGTAGYMSPEQAAGKPADRRADIWSFGVVLYEMLSGKRLFDGESISHTLADVLRAPIDLSQLPPTTPPAIRELLRRCLDRNLKTRLQHIGEARIAIENAKTAPVSPAPVPQHTARWTPWFVAAAVSILSVAGSALWLSRPAQAPLPAAFEVNPPPGASFIRTSASQARGAVISPDGRTLAFVAINGKGDSMLYLRPLDSLTARPVPGTNGAILPFWSPDSKTIAFTAGGVLKRVEVSGGAPTILAEVVARGGSWNSDGVILVGNLGGGLNRISASGGKPSPVTKVDAQAGDIRHLYPQFLGNGKEFLYLILNGDPDKTGIAVGSLDAKPGERPALVLQTLTAARFHAPSKLLFYLEGESNLMARRLELNPPRLVGDPILVAEDVYKAQLTRAVEFSVSETGTLFYARSAGSLKVRFGWRDRTGKALERFGDPIQAIGPFRLAPDRTRLAYMAGPVVQLADVWVLDLARNISTRITFNHGASPTWSPDAKFIYYNNEKGIYRKAADGSGEEVLVATGNTGQISSVSEFISSVAPDGSALLLHGRGDIMRIPLSGNTKPEPFVKTQYNESSARFSPDGRWVAYTSNESGRPEIYVRGYPDTRGKSVVSSGGGVFPVWRQDGKELFWAAPDGTIVAAPIELTATGVRPGRPQLLFRLPRVFDSTLTFQVSDDGQKFLVYEPDSTDQEHPTMVVVQNWTAKAGH